MSRMPSFFRQGGRIKPPHPNHPIQNVPAARAYFESVGSTVRDPQPAPGGGRVWILDHRGWSHGGVSDDGLIHIANEDARLYPAPAQD